MYTKGLQEGPEIIDISIETNLEGQILFDHYHFYATQNVKL